jgi:hypothetical protein
MDDITYHFNCMFCSKEMNAFEDDGIKSVHCVCINNDCSRQFYIIITDQYIQASFNIKNKYKVWIFFDDFEDEVLSKRIHINNYIPPSYISASFLFEYNDLNIFDSDDTLIQKIESLLLLQ